jgi:hypothetical protein
MGRSSLGIEETANGDEPDSSLPRGSAAFLFPPDLPDGLAIAPLDLFWRDQVFFKRGRRSDEKVPGGILNRR